MKKILLAFGTRPEAVKMCPLALALRQREGVKTVICLTGQHGELVSPVLEAFGLAADHDLRIMTPEQSLFDVTESVLRGMRGVLEAERPDILLVHGDTTTAFAAALAGYYLDIPVGHVEAGLRTYDVHAPYPEEFNRRAADIVARWHFAPTETAAANLLREGCDPARVFVTGNTVIDALRSTVRADYTHPELSWAAQGRMLLITAHRRESIGEPMRRMFRAIRRVVSAYPDVRALYPVHPNPQVRAIAREELGDAARVRLIEPLDIVDFHNFLARAWFVLTDSGGIQEEAPALGVPVLVMRDVTERPEGVEAGALRLVGTDGDAVEAACRELLDDPSARSAMARAVSPYGDGEASRRIAEILCTQAQNTLS